MILLIYLHPQIESKPEKFIKRIGEIFTGIRPSISFDPQTGIPSVQLPVLFIPQLSLLLSKEMIYKENDEHFIYDVFLERWLESL